MKLRITIIVLMLLAVPMWWLGQSSTLSPELKQAEVAMAESVQPWQLAPSISLSRLAAPGNSGFEKLPEGVVKALEPQPEIPSPGQSLTLALSGDTTARLIVAGSITHANGDITVQARGEGTGFDADRATLTYGRDGLFARINVDNRLYLVHSDATGTWLLDLNDERLEVDPLHNDTLGQPVLHPMATSAALTEQDPIDHTVDMLAELASQSDGEAVSQIDVMFIYTPDMLVRYPGSLIETRLNHLVALANQTMIDSKAPIAVRLVHHQNVNYSEQTENRFALWDMVRALRGEPIPGLAGLNHIRDRHGADIVALTWPQNIETRGNCGVAYFPQQTDSGQYDRNFGVHIDNDGASNWSVCSDLVFTHELGHNLNAEHQRSRSSGDDPGRSNYAFVRDGRFHTVMGSFGTGEPARYWRVGLFSNPAIQCGGEPCGVTTPGQGSNNVAEITRLAPVVASYSSPATPGTVQRPPPSEPDSDGDGVSDWDDPYPFDPFDGQPDPDAPPALVFEPRQLRQTQTEADWELLVASSGSDQVLAFGLDGHFRGVTAAPEAADGGPILTEFTDMAVDDQGRLYLLASGDVRRFDRLSGELIDIYMDSSGLTPHQLQSPFPRAMGFIPGGQFIVLGDNAIERYGENRFRLNFPSSNEPKSDPEHWNDLTDLPLRAFGFRQFRLYVLEAQFNRIMVFSTAHGFRMTDIAGPDNPHISDPWDLAFTTDGHLLVANGSAGNILRFHIASNSFVDEFVPAGTGGLEFARAVTFGPDGHLYVACQNTHRVLRFDGQTGAPLGVVAQAGIGGLNSPSSIVFTPVLDQIHAGHSGHYYVPDRSGEGWLIEVLDSEYATMGWFTYPHAGAEGEQAWMVGYGAIEGNRIVYEEVLSTRGSSFGPGAVPGDLVLEDWGRMEFEFANCDGGTLHYQGPEEFGSGSLSFTRLIRIPGLPCGSLPRDPEPGAPGVSGQWYDPAMVGQGWFLEEIEPGLVFSAWFTYEQDGRQAWIVGTGVIDGPTIFFDNLLITGGTHFGEDFNADDVIREHWGTMTITLLSCDRAVLDYDSVFPEYGSGQFEPHRLSRLDGLDCELP